MHTLFNSETSQKRGQIGQSCPKDIVPFLAVFYSQTSCPVFWAYGHSIADRIEHASPHVEHTLNISLGISESFLLFEFQ